MGTLIILALSNAATMLLTAWLLHRHTKGLSPLPSIPRKIKINSDENDDEPVYVKGRPIL